MPSMNGPCSSTPREPPSGPTLMTDEERAERMGRVWQKYLAGQTITLQEFLQRRKALTIVTPRPDAKE